MKNRTTIIVIVLLIAAIAYFGYKWWQKRKLEQEEEAMLRSPVNGNGIDTGIPYTPVGTMPVAPAPITSPIVGIQPGTGAIIAGTGNEDMASGEVDLQIWQPTDIGISVPYDQWAS